MKTWLITGCSSGLGKSLAEAALKKGDKVIVTARNLKTVKEFKERYPQTALILSLDVTSQSMIKECVKKSVDYFGRIDVLVNNAGYGYRAAVEEGNNDDVMKLFNTNFWGAVNIIKEVLPFMRKQNSGAIINISSVAAANTFPGSGYYGASKCALEGISSALQKELEPLNIKVMVVEPGAFRTNFSGTSLKQSDTKIHDYDETAGQRRIEKDNVQGTQCGDPDKGAKLIIEAIEANNTPFKLILGKDALDIVSQTQKLRIDEMKDWIEKSIKTKY